MEVMQKMSDKPLARHAKCGGKLSKEWSRTGFQFKGSGWYVTDYAGRKPDAKEGGESKESKPEGVTKESKSEGAAEAKSTDAVEKAESKPAKGEKKSKSTRTTG